MNSSGVDAGYAGYFIQAPTTATTANWAVYGTTNNTGAFSSTTGASSAIAGLMTATGNTGAAVYANNASTGAGYGVYSTTSATGAGAAVYGVNTSSGVGGYFSSTSGYGLIVSTGNVGIGTTSPGTPLDIYQTGGSSGTASALTLRAGNSFNYSGNNQILFGYNGTATYQHDIKTRHNGTAAAGNDIDFYVWNYGTDASTTVGSKQVMTLDGTGNVGIGAMAPLDKVTINGAGTGGLGVNFDSTNYPNIRGIMRHVGNNGGAGGGLEIIAQGANNASNSSGDINFFVTSTNSANSSTDASTVDAMTIRYNGNVGIGTAAPAEPLEIYSSGSGVLLQLAGSSGTCNHTPGSSSETVSCSSDMRMKTDTHDAASALPWLSSIRIRDFTWKPTGQKRTGVIAQELQKTHPEMVTYNGGTDEWTVEQPNPWTLVKLLQEQQAEIDDLKKQLASKR